MGLNPECLVSLKGEAIEAQMYTGKLVREGMAIHGPRREARGEPACSLDLQSIAWRGISLHVEPPRCATAPQKPLLRDKAEISVRLTQPS